MTRWMKFSVVSTLLGCFTIIGAVVAQSSGTTRSKPESSAAYRYRTSQIAHWRAFAMRS